MPTKGVDRGMIQRLIAEGRATITGGQQKLRAEVFTPVSKAKGVHKAGVMNKTESLYAFVLESMKQTGEIKRYWYEGVKLRLADKTSFTADFLVELADGSLELHEVKPRSGKKYFAHEDARVKIKVAAEMYPCFTFKIVWPRKGGGWDQQIIPGKA